MHTLKRSQTTAILNNGESVIMGGLIEIQVETTNQSSNFRVMFHYLEAFSK